MRSKDRCLSQALWTDTEKETERERQKQMWRETGCVRTLVPRRQPSRPSLVACLCFPDGKPVEVDPHHILIEDPDGSCTLIVDNLTGVDSGQYMCFAASAAGNASTLGKILVQGEPRGLPDVISVHSQWHGPCPENRLWWGQEVWSKPEGRAGGLLGMALLEVRPPRCPPQCSLRSIRAKLSFLSLSTSAHSAPKVREQGPGHTLCGRGGRTDHLHRGRLPVPSDQVGPVAQRMVGGLGNMIPD